MFTRCATLILVLALAVGVAGCGGNDPAEYERDLAKIGRHVDTALAQLPTDDSTTLGADEIATLADDLREAAQQLDDLKPPDDAVAPQKKLQRGLVGVADAFDDLATDLRNADSDQAKANLFVAFATNEKIDKAFQDIEDAQDAYGRAGYRVFGTESTNKVASTSS